MAVMCKRKELSCTHPGKITGIAGGWSIYIHASKHMYIYAAACRKSREGVANQCLQCKQKAQLYPPNYSPVEMWTTKCIVADKSIAS
jgi:hypothetical protein